MSKFVIYMVIIFLFFTNCFLFEIYKPDPNRPVYVDIDPEPNNLFKDYKFNRISVRKFISENDEIREKLFVGIIKEFYKSGKVEVLEGEIIKNTEEKVITELSAGDIQMKTKTKEEIISTDYSPYPGVDLLIHGTVYSFKKYYKDFEYSYVKLNFRIIDPKKGTIYWIADMEGYYKDIIYTIVNTINNRNLTVPAGTENATK